MHYTGTVIFIIYTVTVPSIPVIRRNGTDMPSGTDEQKTSVPATDLAIAGFGTVGIDKTVILRFFP